MERVPKNPPHVLAPTDPELEQANVTPGWTADQCSVCRGHRTFRWYKPNSRDPADLTDWECDCDEQRILSLWFTVRGFPLSLQRRAWADLHGVDPAGVEWATSYVLNFESMLANGIGAVVTGDHGSGKTSVANAVAKSLMFRGVPVRRIAASDLIAWADNWREPEMRDRWQKVILPTKVLLIDDLGKERGNEAWVMARIEHTVRFRTEANLPTIITTSLPELRIAEKYGTDTMDVLSERTPIRVLASSMSFRGRALEQTIFEAEHGLSRPVVFQ